MINSCIPWIGEIPKEWSVCPLKTCIRWKSEKNHEDATVLSLYRDYGIVPKDSRDDNFNVTSLYTSGYKYVEVGDLVINKMKAWQGSIAVSDYEGIVSPAYHVCEITNERVYKRYLHYLLRNSSYLPEYMRLSTGLRIGQWDLGYDDFKNIKVILPKADEQQRIVSFLDAECNRIDKVIEQTKASIEEYKKLKQSIITQAVTKGIRPDREMKDSGIEWIGEIPVDWNMSKVKYVAEFQPSCDTSKLKEDSEISYTPMECIKNGYFINNTALYGSISASLTPYNNGDIVIAKVTPCFENGNIAVMEALFSGCGFGSSELFVIRPHLILTRFLFYWFQNNLFIQRGCASMTGTGGLKRISPYFVKNCPVVLPKESEQKKIVLYLDGKIKELDLLMAKKEEYLAELESYKKSIIFEHVTGKKEVPIC